MDPTLMAFIMSMLRNGGQQAQVVQQALTGQGTLADIFGGGQGYGGGYNGSGYAGGYGGGGYTGGSQDILGQLLGAFLGGGYGGGYGGNQTGNMIDPGRGQMTQGMTDSSDPRTNPANWTSWKQAGTSAALGRAKPARSGKTYTGPEIPLPIEPSPEEARAIAAQQWRDLGLSVTPQNQNPYALGGPLAGVIPLGSGQTLTSSGPMYNQGYGHGTPSGQYPEREMRGASMPTASRALAGVYNLGQAGNQLSSYNPPANYVAPRSSAFGFGEPYRYPSPEINYNDPRVGETVERPFGPKPLTRRIRRSR